MSPPSQGAAIALIDAAYLRLHLSGITVNSIVYASPRVSGSTGSGSIDPTACITGWKPSFRRLHRREPVLHPHKQQVSL